MNDIATFNIRAICDREEVVEESWYAFTLGDACIPSVHFAKTEQSAKEQLIVLACAALDVRPEDIEVLFVSSNEYANLISVEV